MKRYYLDVSFKEKGKNLVHKEGCINMPVPSYREYLGVFTSCCDAVSEAKRRVVCAEACELCSEGCSV